MADTVGIRALQQHASQVVARVAAGEVLVVTDRGRPVARLVPYTADTLTALVDAGLARPAVLDPGALADPPAGPPLTDALAQVRGDER